MLVGALPDDQGKARPVSYTSFDVDDQMISVVTAGLLGLNAERLSFHAGPGPLEIPVRVRRHESLKDAPVRVALRTPRHIKGVQSEELQLAPGEKQGVLRARVDAGAGPFNLPVEIVATTVPAYPGEPTHTAALSVEFLPPQNQ